MAGQWKPIGDRTFTWDTTQTTYRGAPVVISAAAAETVTNPAGTSADVIIGVAAEDAGPSAVGSAANEKSIAVQIFGVLTMYAKGAITQGARVKIGPTISITPAGYTSAITVYTGQAATQAAAGAQPYPIVGVALNTTSQDGDLLYVWFQQGAMY